ncbi:MAG TPA: cytochrome c oxidase subunit 3 [Candidatus Eremiobacteraceae bacterium]|nr:cytochrome c oxidase subunit 3 [Candidatus Eremiobacteraceae bacterium]
MDHHATSPLPFRAHPLVFGVVLFLASELMFFAGLFAAYFDLRSLATVWPPAGVRLDVVQSSAGTLLLAVSSASMFGMNAALDRQRFALARVWLGSAMACGIVFLGIALHGWSQNTFTIASNAYGSLFYAMTGFHALHVAVGIALLGALFAGMRTPAFTADRRAGAEAVSYYWHFVFIVWLGIWGTIYLIR